MDQDLLRKLAIILGPTGSGKSDLGLRLAEELHGEIVNCDSVQVYRRFQIGTAKVPAVERRGIPHHLLDVVEPADHFTAGDYAIKAGKVLEEIAGRGRIPIVVGGTGFYLRALLQGLSPGPKRDEQLRENLLRREQRRPGSLHRILQRLDRASAIRVHPNDRNKTLRALEVRLLEGAPVSAMFARPRDPLVGFRIVKVGLNPNRQSLYGRLDSRTIRIFENGLVQEVRDLLAAGITSKVKPFESLGYVQALQEVQGFITHQQAIESTQQETRRYAKRQMTWFRREADVHWLAGFGDEPRVQEEALALLRGR